MSLAPVRCTKQVHQACSRQARQLSTSNSVHATSKIQVERLEHSTRRYATATHVGSPRAAAPSSAELPNELMRIIVNHVKTHGPMPLPRYIGFCLGHPTLGYYTRSASRAAAGTESGTAVIGSKGDFITSPEISQVFGELLAIWYVTQWQAQKMPPKSRIVELGPGRGTLIDDMLRTMKAIRAFGKTLSSVHLVENSPYMKGLQEKKLEKWINEGLQVHWHDHIQDVPVENENTFTMLAAHEFFDALPIHLFEKRAEGFREVFVDIEKAKSESRKVLIPGQPEPSKMVNEQKKASESTPPNKLRLVTSPSATLASRLLVPDNDPRFKGLSQGTRVEVCSDAYAIAASAAKLVRPCGAGLIIDYGADRFFSNSFRAFKQHQLADPLADPGSADLTSNVDFTSLREALTASYTNKTLGLDNMKEPSPAPKDIGSGVHVAPLLSQRSFLLSLGLQLRVENLLKNAADDKRRKDIITAAQRLVEKNEKMHGMGKVFKVLGFVPQQEGSGGTQDVFPFGQELD